MNNFKGSRRSFASSFSLNNAGYLGLGDNSERESIFLTFNAVNDFWRYDPATDTWQEVGSFPGGRRNFTIGFAANNKGYFGFGVEELELIYDDLWEYNPETNSWLQVEKSFPEGARAFMTGTGIPGSGFLTTGLDAQENNTVTWKTDIWEYIIRIP